MRNLPSQRLMIKCLTIIQIELEFGSVGFSGEGKTEVSGDKPLGARTRTNNKLNPHMTPSPGIEPGQHWWEACVGGKCSTTAPSLPHQKCCTQTRYHEGLPTLWIVQKIFYFNLSHHISSILC